MKLCDDGIHRSKVNPTLRLMSFPHPAPTPPAALFACHQHTLQLVLIRLLRRASSVSSDALDNHARWNLAELYSTALALETMVRSRTICVRFVPLHGVGPYIPSHNHRPTEEFLFSFDANSQRRYCGFDCGCGFVFALKSITLISLLLMKAFPAHKKVSFCTPSCRAL